MSKIIRCASFNLSQNQDASSRKAIAEGDDVKIINPDAELDFGEPESLAGHPDLSFPTPSLSLSSQGTSI